MKHQAALILSLPLLLTGCAGGPPPGPLYSDVQQSFPPIADAKARVIFFREHAYGGSAMPIDITLSGKPVGTNYDRSAFYSDVVPGHREFAFKSANLSLFSGTIPLDIEAGHTYYVQLYVPGGPGAILGALGGKPIEDGMGKTHCGSDACAQEVSAGAAQSVLGTLTFNSQSAT